MAVILVLGRAHTIPILSANFLLIGLVSLLTSVPSGYNMNVKGVSCCSACRPKNANSFTRYSRSDAHERAKNMKLKNCIPCAISSKWHQQSSCSQGNGTYPSYDRDPFQTLLEDDEHIAMCAREVCQSPRVPPVSVYLRRSEPRQQAQQTIHEAAHLVIRNEHRLQWEVYACYSPFLILDNEPSKLIFRERARPFLLERYDQPCWRKPLAHQDCTHSQLLI